MPTEPSLSPLYHFVVEKAPDALPERRAKIYRALAAIIGNENDARALVALAAECEALELRCRQLELNFGKTLPLPAKN